MASLMNLENTRTHVSLLNAHNVCVGQGFLGRMKVGEILHTRAIREDEVVVFVTHVIDGSCSVDEPFRKLLSECERTFIRWNYQQLQVLPDHLSTNVNAISSPPVNNFAVFDWGEADGVHDGGRKMSILEQKKLTKNREDAKEDKKRTFMQRQSINIATPASTSMQIDEECQVYGHVNSPLQKRKYVKVIRGSGKESMERKIGEDRLNKVSLSHVRRWITGFPN
jgi:hypothetical protein